MRYCLNLTDQATANFSNLTSLVWLSISGNKLSDVMLDNLAWATNLSVLDIPKSDVTDVGVARFASMVRQSVRAEY
jgi:Leucine-rich repeat (LRR) protein